MEQFSRTQRLLGKDAMQKLENATVAVFGIGGVGSFAAEALARSGIGHLILVDGDIVDITNINRQLIALKNTIGQKKAFLMKDRIAQINEQAQVEAFDCFFTKDNMDFIDFSKLDYVIDAVDMVSAKLLLMEQAKAFQIPIISCMGAGNKLDATAFRVADISQTSVCPLAKVMRKECKTRGLKDIKVVYSTELPIIPEQSLEELPQGKRQIPGSVSFVPSVAGMILAGEVVKELAKIEKKANNL